MLKLKNYPSDDTEFNAWYRETNPTWRDDLKRAISGLHGRAARIALLAIAESKTIEEAIVIGLSYNSDL